MNAVSIVFFLAHFVTSSVVLLKIATTIARTTPMDHVSYKEDVVDEPAPGPMSFDQIDSCVISGLVQLKLQIPSMIQPCRGSFMSNSSGETPGGLASWPPPKLCWLSRLVD